MIKNRSCLKVDKFIWIENENKKHDQNKMFQDENLV